jgi:hypothetical protein
MSEPARIIRVLVSDDLARDAKFVARFWSKVLQADGCWVWQGARHADGYGQLGRGNKNILAHRISWQLHNGPIPAGLNALHKCDNRICVRPDHLFLGTRADTKGRRASCCGDANPNAKLTRAQVAAIRADLRGPNAIAADYSIHRRTVWAIRKGRLWTG